VFYVFNAKKLNKSNYVGPDNVGVINVMSEFYTRIKKLFIFGNMWH
jgi:hypothetical protein